MKKSVLERIGLRRIATSFIAVFGLLSLICKTIDLFVPSSIPRGWLGLIAFIVASAIVSLKLCWPRKSVSAKLSSPDTSVEIRVGDLFDQTGHLVIGTNDCFDTELGDVISPNSIQGQFLSRKYNGDEGRLDRDIEVALKAYQDKRAEDLGKIRGKPWRYAIGTVATLGSGSSRYFLPAYTKMGNDLVCTSNADCLWFSLTNLWEEVRGKGECGEVSMGVIGSELARTGLPRQVLVELIVLSFLVASKRKVVSKKLNILIHPSDLKYVDMSALEQFLASACF